MKTTTLTKSDIVELFEQKPLPHTTSTSELAKRYNRQLEINRYLLEALGRQTSALLEMREHIALQQVAIETLANCIGAEPDDGSKIILPDTPALIIN